MGTTGKAFDIETFAARLRGKRAEKDISQSELAEKINVTPDSVHKYENAKMIPSGEKVFLLALALGTTPNYLVGWEE